MVRKSEVRNHYNEIAVAYGNRYQGLSERYFDAMEDRCIYQLADFANKTVLDMGTGAGRFALSILREGRARQVIGIDIAERFIEVARSLQKEDEHISFCVMDAENTSFNDSVFDSVIVLGLFEYVQDLTLYFRECGRILKPGGELIFTCWNINKWFGWKLFNDRMEGSVDHSLNDLKNALMQDNFELAAGVSTFFIPTRLFFALYRRLGGSARLQSVYVNTVISLERGLRKSFFRLKGGELIIKAVKV